MSNNKTKIDNLHDLMPPYFKTRKNINWKALIESIGQSDQDTADLIEAVRAQIFTKTANRPYLDKLGANVNVNRPRFIGMQDLDFRKYIPISAYQPKQVKLVLDLLLDLFFYKESTTSHITSINVSPFYLKDGWELDYTVDGVNNEHIIFKSLDFSNINSATADEVVSAINRQAKYSYAVGILDNVTLQKNVRIFTKTIGSKGSILISGGRACIGIDFGYFITGTGGGFNTQWTVSKIGDTTTFQYDSGDAPGLNNVSEGDIFICDMSGNIGSFVVSDVNISSLNFTFVNLFSTIGTFTQSSDKDIKFIRPTQSNIYKNSLRAISWETRYGEISVEMPSTPPIVKRVLKGSAHVNGTYSLMSNRVSDSSMAIIDASIWPNSGHFAIEQVNEIMSRSIIGTQTIDSSNISNSRFIGPYYKYSYTGKTGNTLTGITPSLPVVASLNEFNILSISRDTSNHLIVETDSANGYEVGENVSVHVINNVNSVNGAWEIDSIINTTTFKAYSPGAAVTIVVDPLDTVWMERINMSNSGSRVLLLDSLSSSITGIIGPTVWDSSSLFTLSKYTGSILENIYSGQIKKVLTLGSNDLPTESGYVILDYGLNNQEGPIKCIYKPTDSTIVLDPSYIFQENHTIGSSITRISKMGAHELSTTGKEYAFYVTDTAGARTILQDLLKEVKSAGIFINYIVRFPNQIYNLWNVYN